jgi:oxygen-independent coproporphyrinogen III oxidase
MRSQEAAFYDARSSLHRLGIPHGLLALHDAGISISRDVLGGSHSVAIYPPIDSLVPLDSQCVVETLPWGRATSLYVHVAFCESRCTFCHYTVDHYAGRAKASGGQETKVARYLAALNRELAFWGTRLARTGTAVSSVYIGGGTPLVLDEAALRGLISTIQNEFNLLAGAEFCIEGSPLTVTAPDGEDKLRSLKEQGITRLSFGVQSFDDEVLKYAARGYKRNIPIRACAIASGIFENWTRSDPGSLQGIERRNLGQSCDDCGDPPATSHVVPWTICGSPSRALVAGGIQANGL